MPVRPAPLREWTLSRELAPPVAFTGRLLRSVDGRAFITTWDKLVGKQRHHQISLFETSEGRHLLYVTFSARGVWEYSHKLIIPLNHLGEIAATLAGYIREFTVAVQSSPGLSANERASAAEVIASRFARLSERLQLAIGACTVKID